METVKVWLLTLKADEFFEISKARLKEICTLPSLPEREKSLREFGRPFQSQVRCYWKDKLYHQECEDCDFHLILNGMEDSSEWDILAQKLKH